MSDSILDPCTDEGCALALAGVAMMARGSGALWLVAERALVVSDLHLGKAERHLRRTGGFLPPYENEATLARLEAEVAATAPDLLILLGDTFDDDACVANLDAETRGRIEALTGGQRTIWVAGNHDPAPTGLPGQSADEVRLGPLTFRHIAEPGATGEVSGHYHPRLTITAKARRIRRKCFLADAHRVILPAFGAYTGGLDLFDAALAKLVDAKDGEAILTGERAMRAPLRRLRRAA